MSKNDIPYTYGKTSYNNNFIREILTYCIDEENENINFDLDNLVVSYYEDNNMKKVNQLNVIKRIIDKCIDNGIFKLDIKTYVEQKAFLSNLVECVYLLTCSNRFIQSNNLFALSFTPINVLFGSYNVIIKGKLYAINEELEKENEYVKVALRIMFNSSYVNNNGRFYFADEYAINLRKVNEIDTTSEYIMSPTLSAADFLRETFKQYEYKFEPTYWSIMNIYKEIPEKTEFPKNTYSPNVLSTITNTEYLNETILDAYFKTVMYATDIIHHTKNFYRDWKIQNCMLAENPTRIILTDIDFDTTDEPISTIRCYELTSILRKHLLLSMFKKFPSECLYKLRSEINFDEEISYNDICNILSNFDLEPSKNRIIEINKKISTLMDNIIAFYSWLITSVRFTHSKRINFKILNGSDSETNIEELLQFINKININSFYSGKNAYVKINQYIQVKYNGYFNKFVEIEFKNIIFS